MALIKFFINSLIIRFYSMLQRRCVNHDIVALGRYRLTFYKEYVFPLSFIKKLNIFLYC
ncbi:MAG: hypothetical protein ACTIH2_00540 [Anaerococcus sp.]